MDEEKNQGGRPRTYSTPEEFDSKVDEYVNDCTDKEEPLTWTGLALYLGFSSRKSIDEYQKYDGFSHSVKRAKLLIENSYEKRLYSTCVTGPIFALKNFGWRDKTDEAESEQEAVPLNIVFNCVDGRLTDAD